MKNNLFFKKQFVIQIFVFSILIGFSVPAIWAGADEKEAEVLYPNRTQEKPRIDGILDDKAWQNPPMGKDFIAYYPEHGKIMPFNTLVWVSYDNENIYFAFRCDDPEPGKIKTSITKRDNVYADDWVGLSLDTLGTRQMSIGFFVNPNGIQGDTVIPAVGDEDGTPDFIWDSAAKITPEGFQAEICLPFQSISFQGSEEVKMGILFWRRISRLSMRGTWPQVQPGHGVYDTHTKIVFKDVKNPFRLELLPTITHGSNRERINPQEWGKSDTFTDLSLGIKYGLTSSITTEMTINPDTSQVESDAFQVEVNRRYPVLLLEKRPFFTEDPGIIDFFTVPNGFLPYAVYTRRIVDPLWGVKLSGVIGQVTVGLMATGDEGPGQAWTSGTNPNEGKKAFFGVARGKYSLGRDKYIGLFYTEREFAGDYNRLIGADGSYWLSRNQQVNASFLYGMSGGGKSSSSINFLYTYNIKPLKMQTAFQHIGKDFRMDISYLQRIGIDHGWGAFTYRFYTDFKKFSGLKRIAPRVFFQYLHDLTTGMNDSNLDLGVDLTFTHEGELGIHYIFKEEAWKRVPYKLEQLNISGIIQPTLWLTVSGKIIYGDKIYYTVDPSYRGKGYDTELLLEIRPNEKLNQQFSFSHSDLSRGGKKMYDVNILYSRTAFQFNKYFFLRGVVQYNSYYKKMLTDFLASFTLIPGTVLHVGYGGLYENRNWQDNQWLYRQGDLLHIKRSFFLKVGYLWRL